MKIAISSSGKDLSSQLDPRFGRCRYFLIIETDTMSFEVFDNDNAALGGGAGIQSAQFIAAKGAKVFDYRALRPQCDANAVCCRSSSVCRASRLSEGHRGNVPKWEADSHH